MTAWLVAATLALPAIPLLAEDAGNPASQRPRRGQAGPPHAEGQRPVPPLIAVLDANQDGVLDAQEIANAANALKTLDKNNDGILSLEELHPGRPPGAGPRGLGGPGGPGGRGSGPRRQGPLAEESAIQQ
jgi:hypothetical protein